MRPSFATNIHDPGRITILGRPTCFDCFRPHSHCVCNFIPPFAAHCNTLILQHPHERKKYYSTVKLLSKAVTNLTLLRGLEFDATALENKLHGQKPYLLYPSADAIDCTDVTLDSGNTVIVIDGTWREAQKIIFRNRFLTALPCLSFKSPITSKYRIRKQPKAGYLSTLESLGYLLKLNAQSSGNELLAAKYDSLFEGFHRMIDQQLNYWPVRDRN